MRNRLHVGNERRCERSSRRVSRFKRGRGNHLFYGARAPAALLRVFVRNAFAKSLARTRYVFLTRVALCERGGIVTGVTRVEAMPCSRKAVGVAPPGVQAAARGAGIADAAPDCSMIRQSPAQKRATGGNVP